MFGPVRTVAHPTGGAIAHSRECAAGGWVFASGVVDYAAVGEGVQTFSELLEAMLAGEEGHRLIPGLWRQAEPRIPLFRKPIANLDDVSSPITWIATTV